MLVAKKLVGADFLQVFDFQLKEIGAAVTGGRDQVMGAANQAGSVERLPGEVFGKVGEIAVTAVEFLLRPLFEAVGNALTGAIDQGAEAIPAATFKNMTKMPFRGLLVQLADQRCRTGGNAGLAAGFGDGGGEIFCSIRTRRRYLSWAFLDERRQLSVFRFTGDDDPGGDGQVVGQ